MSATSQKWRLRILLGFLAGIITLTIFVYFSDSILTSLANYIETHRQVHREIISHWKRFTNDECGFTVSFPSRPFEHPQTLSNRQNVVSYRQFASVLGSNQVFIVATLITSLTNTLSDEQGEIIMAQIMRGVAGDDKLLARKNITLGTKTGREVELVKSDGYFYKMRYYLIEHGLQTLTVRVPQADKGSTNISYFLDSFRLIAK